MKTVFISFFCLTFYCSFNSVEVSNNATIMVINNNAKVLLNYEPFRIDFFLKDELVISVNPNGALKFEQFRKKVYFLRIFTCFQLFPYGWSYYFFLHYCVASLLRYKKGLGHAYIATSYLFFRKTEMKQKQQMVSGMRILKIITIQNRLVTIIVLHCWLMQIRTLNFSQTGSFDFV